MELQINCTDEGIKSYPLHSHKSYEIMQYIEGEGYLRTQKKKYVFSPGTIIIVPPMIEHGSVSEHGFKNISICGNFKHLLTFGEIFVLKDTDTKEGEILSTLIYHNRFRNDDYVFSLCTAYIQFILQNIKFEKNIEACIKRIISDIYQNAFNSEFNVTISLSESGYSEDYIRDCFKKATGKTPIAFLTNLRINHACYLIELYRNILSLSEISEKCGFLDYTYFSKKFKAIKGISPSAYRYIKPNANVFKNEL